MSYRAAPRDARRGALFILNAGEDGPNLADSFAEAGYEVLSIDLCAAEEMEAVFAPPIFTLAYPDGAADAWTAQGQTAISIVADARVAGLLDVPPRAPATLHLTPEAHDLLAERFAMAQPELPVHRLQPGADGDRLLRLRTLRLFALNSGGRQHGAPD